MTVTDGTLIIRHKGPTHGNQIPEVNSQDSERRFDSSTSRRE